MLRSVNDVHGYTISASDGDVGNVEDLYFDDEAWGVRDLVVDTGSWLPGRKVLMSPFSVARTDGGERSIHVKLTREQVKDSPDIDTRKPVSRQHELEHLRYFGYPVYWGGPYLWGLSGYPMLAPGLAPRAAPAASVAAQKRERVLRDTDRRSEDSRLRSTEQVKGYHILAADDGIGHVEGFIFDDEAWDIRYLVIDPANWWPGGRKALIATRWINGIDWPQRTVNVNVTRDAIRNSPDYDPEVPITRDYEARLHEFYGRAIRPQTPADSTARAAPVREPAP
jgi:sporulation protein YlmC with PRC-barrel domain